MVEINLMEEINVENIPKNIPGVDLLMNDNKKGGTKKENNYSNTIDELELHLEVENSLGGFYETSCDVVQKINNYLWLCGSET